MELELGKGVKNNKNNSCRYVSTKQKLKKNIGPLLRSTGSSVMNDTEKGRSTLLYSLCLGLHGQGQLPSLCAKKQQ